MTLDDAGRMNEPAMTLDDAGIIKRAFAWFRRYSFDGYLSGALLFILSVIAVARSLQHMYVVDINQEFQYGLWWHLPFNLFMWWNWFLFVPVMYWTISRLERGDRRAVIRSLMLYLVLPIAIIALRQAVATVIATAVLADKSDFFVLFYWRLFTNPWLWLDLIVYFAILLGLHVVEYQRRSEQSELRRMQLKTQYVRSQLAALKSQLQPHFLFNTLNTVSTLILKEDNAEAERMLTLLDQFLRTTACEPVGQEVTLRDELRFIGHYLEIEKVRFSDKLQVSESIHPETLDAIIPSFLLQPIVENAIYHAIAVKASPGEIRIASRINGASLVLTVEDNGPGFSAPKRKKNKEGVGLAITRERLEHLYGGSCEFHTETMAAGGARVTIAIPLAIVKSGRRAS
ncbi:MAG TPA: histidine kinase [Bacteroidota bacterium]|nr:histidine kinase [Bacteroidota bacterium]